MKNFNSAYFILLVLLSLFFISAFSPKLKKVKLNENVSIRLPEDFLPMTDDDIARKYYTYRKPLAAFTNPEQVANFSFNQSVTPWRQKDIILLKDFYKASVMKLYTKVDFVQENIVSINKRDFAVLEFTSQVSDEDKNSPNFGKVTRGYDYIQYTVEKGKVLIFHFSCPFQMKENWSAKAKEIMMTVKIK